MFANFTNNNTIKSKIYSPILPNYNPYLYFAGNNGTIYTDPGWKTHFYGGNGVDWMAGDALSDTLYGFAGEDRLAGEGGRDWLHGGSQNDILYGGDGDDVLFGGDDDDSLFGGDGADELVGDAGNDILYAGEDDDTDLLFGGDGNDIFYAGHEDSAYGGDSDDIIHGAKIIHDGGGSNQVYSGAGDDQITAGDGAAADTYDGGSGIDFISYRHSTGGVTVDLMTGTGSGGAAAGDVYINIEDVLGSKQSDTLIGNNQTNYLRGNVGDDMLHANGGLENFLEGDTGADQLFAGSGRDHFIFDQGDSGLYYGIDTIHNYNLAHGDILNFAVNPDDTVFTETTQVFTGVTTDTIFQVKRLKDGMAEDIYEVRLTNYAGDVQYTYTEDEWFW